MHSLGFVRVLVICIVLAHAASSNAYGGSSIGTSPPPPITDPLYRVSFASPFTAGCDGVAANGTLYVNSEVEPYVAVNPRNTNNVVGVWQQDRWSNGGARGLMSGASFDGGKSWTRKPLPFSRCGGGNAGNGGNYQRASDPWVSFGPSGIAYAISISFNGNLTQGEPSSAVLASRSLDGGKTWSNPATLIRDGLAFFNDKESITADPANPNNVYAVWDRLPLAAGGGPAMFARSTDAGATWEPARTIYDPGSNSQTVDNEIVVLPNGTLVDLFTQFNYGGTAEARIIRSTDKGLHWSASIKAADLLPVGACYTRCGSFIPQMAVSPSGELFVAWADGRFSAGDHDGIALTHSSNGGLSWSTPVRINGDPTVEAFEPSIHVRSDRTISVTYFDFRYNSGIPNAEPTILWLARSGDAINWRESAVAGPFDLNNAPLFGFLGDYQGLSSIGSESEPFFVQANIFTLLNRTDVFSAPAVSVTAMFNLMVGTLGTSAQAAAPFKMTADFRKRVSDNIRHAMEHGEFEWRDSIRRPQGKPATPPQRQ